MFSFAAINADAVFVGTKSICEALATLKQIHARNMQNTSHEVTHIVT